MKITNQLIFIIGIFLLLNSCKDEQKKEEKYVITGNVSGFPEGTTFYLRDALETISDSSVIDNGTFKFEGQLMNPPESFTLLTQVNKKPIYTTFLIGNDTLKIKGNISDFPFDVSFEGSKIQDENFKYRNLTKNLDISRDSIYRSMFKVSKEERKKIEANVWKQMAALDSITENINLKFIKSHPTSFSSILSLEYFKSKLPKDSIREIFNGFSSEIKGSRYGEAFKVFLSENILDIGDKFYDFEGTNQKNQKVKFSEIRGKYTLLDFTAKNCGGCIKAAPELVEINNDYKDSVKIISFSCDTKKENWLQANERDRVTWDCIWDGKGFRSFTYMKYGIQGFPSFVLINPEGIIVDKWFGYFGKGSIKKRLADKILL